MHALVRVTIVRHPRSRSLVNSIQVQIPNNTDTTYWCAATELPQEVQQRQQYVIRVRRSHASTVTILILMIGIRSKICIGKFGTRRWAIPELKTKSLFNAARTVPLFRVLMNIITWFNIILACFCVYYCLTIAMTRKTMDIITVLLLYLFIIPRLCLCKIS